MQYFSPIISSVLILVENVCQKENAKLCKIILDYSKPFYREKGLVLEFCMQLCSTYCARVRQQNNVLRRQ
jgi:hypothetical protein